MLNQAYKRKLRVRRYASLRYGHHVDTKIMSYCPAGEILWASDIYFPVIGAAWYEVGPDRWISGDHVEVLEPEWAQEALIKMGDLEQEIRAVGQKLEKIIVDRGFDPMDFVLRITVEEKDEG